MSILMIVILVLSSIALAFVAFALIKEFASCSYKRSVADYISVIIAIVSFLCIVGMILIMCGVIK